MTATKLARKSETGPIETLPPWLPIVDASNFGGLPTAAGSSTLPEDSNSCSGVAMFPDYPLYSELMQSQQRHETMVWYGIRG